MVGAVGFEPTTSSSQSLDYAMETVCRMVCKRLVNKELRYYELES